ncbi:MAG: HAMP domain-containing protein [Alphaproteobacteria bacterium]|nr:HAMP domain-containing protein [Alphaproteobacteria bacterium]
MRTPRRLRDLLPKGLYWRTILIILVPAALLQLLVTIIFLDDHWRFTSKRMSQGVAGDIALVIDLYERAPTALNFAEIRDLARRRLNLDVAMEPSSALARRKCSPLRANIDRYMEDALGDHLKRPIWYDASCPGRQVMIRVPIAEGMLVVRAFRDRVQARSGPLFVIWIMGATVLLAVVSILFIRNQVRPIETLADAMEEFGRGVDRGMFKARGAREVRRATHAFFDMKNRIKRHIDQRAQLLAGVSHDLRTPITRLKLQFAMMPASDDLAHAKRDLAEMESTLEEYLAFAKGQFSEEATLVDVRELARTAAEEAARAGANVTLEPGAPVTVEVRAKAVKRAVMNLVDNAIAHADVVQVTAEALGAGAVIIVDDNGPGIAEELYDDAFRPFSRLDETRTRNAKGVGLGLAIARDVARGHGGDVHLSRSPLGGLRAMLKLPGAA